MTTASPRIRILIADEDAIGLRRTAAYMAQRGFEVRTCRTGREARGVIRDWKPRFVVADLMLPEGNAFELIDFIKNEPGLRHNFIHVLVLSAHNQEANVKQALERGAKDYIVKPCRYDDLLKRLVFHSRSYRGLQSVAGKDFERIDEASLMLHLTDLVLKQALSEHPLEHILFNLTRMVSIKVDGVRCSLIHVLDQTRGVVVTSNDNRQASGLGLDLYKYPEVVHVMNTQSLVAVENLSENSELRHVRAMAKDILFNSLIVCPVLRFGKPFGVLSLRMPPEKQTISDNEIRFVEIVAHVTSLVLNNEMHRQSGDFWNPQAPRPMLASPLRSVKNS